MAVWVFVLKQQVNINKGVNKGGQTLNPKKQYYKIVSSADTGSGDANAKVKSEITRIRR